MEAKHTSGPWFADSGQGHIWRVYSKPVKGYAPEVCMIRSYDHERENALLITAAPDMLEALRAIESLFEEVQAAGAHYSHRLDAVSIIARAAIEKAEGR